MPRTDNKHAIKTGPRSSADTACSLPTTFHRKIYDLKNAYLSSDIHEGPGTVDNKRPADVVNLT